MKKSQPFYFQDFDDRISLKIAKNPSLVLCIIDVKRLSEENFKLFFLSKLRKTQLRIFLIYLILKQKEQKSQTPSLVLKMLKKIIL